MPTDDYTSTMDASREAGVTFIGEPMERLDFGTTKVLQAFVADPAGNVVELTDMGRSPTDAPTRRAFRRQAQTGAPVDPRRGGFELRGDADEQVLAAVRAHELHAERQTLVVPVQRERDRGLPETLNGDVYGTSATMRSTVRP